MDLRQLEYFVAAVDHGGFTRGAAAVHVAQPSMSQAIAGLERELGIELFVRTGRAVQVTSAGELVAEHARRVLRDVTDLVSLASDVSGAHIGRLDVVALSTLAVDPLAELVGGFRVRHPGVRVAVHEPEDAASIDRWITSGRADLGLTDLTTGGRGLQRVELFRQDVVALCPPRTRVRTGGLTASALAAMPLIATPRGTSTRRLLDQVLARVGDEPNIVVETDQREAIVPLVLAGAGTALVPIGLAREGAARGARLHALRPPVSRRIGLLHRRGPVSPAVRAMIDLAHEVVGDRGDRDRH